MKAFLSVAMSFVLGVYATADVPAKNKATVDLGDYRVTLPPGWRSTDYGPKNRMVALRVKAGETKALGEILAATLPETAEKESAELADSAKDSPDVLTVVESGDFALNSGLKGKKVLMTIKASDRNYGDKQALYSLYLPLAEKGSITLKLRCAAENFPSLRADFERMAAAAERTKK